MHNVRRFVPDKLYISAVAFVVMCGPHSLLADELLTYSAASTGLAGVALSLGTGGELSWFNPAALAAQKNSYLGLYYLHAYHDVVAKVSDWGSLGNIPAYQVSDLDGNLDTEQTKNMLSEELKASSDFADASAVGLNLLIDSSVVLPESSFHWGLGVIVTFPRAGQNIAGIVGGPGHVPSFPVLGQKSTNTRFITGLGVEVWKYRVWLGASVLFSSRISGKVDTLTSVASYDRANPQWNPPRPSEVRMQQSMEPLPCLTGGLKVKPHRLVEFDLVYHQAERMELKLDVGAHMELDLGNPVIISLPYVMSGSYLYRPPRFVGGVSFGNSGLRVSIQAEYSLWSEFTGSDSSMKLYGRPGYYSDDGAVFLQDLGGWFRIAGTPYPKVHTRNVLSPGMAIRYFVVHDKLSVMAGYRYRPSALLENQKFDNFMLDNDTHTASVGANMYLPGAGNISAIKVTLAGYFTYLVPRYNRVGASQSDLGWRARGLVLSKGYLAAVALELGMEF